MFPLLSQDARVSTLTDRLREEEKEETMIEIGKGIGEGGIESVDGEGR